jgi:hypothetical protein
MERPGSIGVEHGAGNEISGDGGFRTTPQSEIQALPPACRRISKRCGLSAAVAATIARAAGFRFDLAKSGERKIIARPRGRIPL